MFTAIKDKWKYYKSQTRLQAGIFLAFTLLAVIAVQVFLIYYMTNSMRFAFSYEYNDGYYSKLDPVRALKESTEWFSAVDFFLLALLYELLFIIDHRTLQRFSIWAVGRLPRTLGEFFYSASAAYLVLYVFGAVYSMIQGIGLFFGTEYGFAGLVLYLSLSLFLVVPILLLIVSVIYIIIYRKKLRLMYETEGGPLEAELWED